MNNEVNIEKIILDKIYDIIKIPINKNTSILNMSIAELDLDSLDFFEFIIHLEDNHHIHIPVDKISNEFTISELIKSATFK